MEVAVPAVAAEEVVTERATALVELEVGVEPTDLEAVDPATVPLPKGAPILKPAAAYPRFALPCVLGEP